MKVTTLLPSSNTFFQDFRFNNFIESHLTYILENYMSGNINIPANIGSRYQGDFYGLLISQGIKVDYHYILLRLNGFTSSSEYNGDSMVIQLPNFDSINRLQAVYKTTQKT